MPTATIERPRAARRSTRRSSIEGQMAVAFCDHCANSIDPNEAESVIQVGVLRFCGEDCAYDSGFVRCQHCGSFYDPAQHEVIAGEKRYCSDACAIGDGNAKCASCGDWHSVEDEGHVTAHDQANGTDVHFCSAQCAEDGSAFVCEDCQGWFMRSDANRTPTGYVCRECANSSYFYCESCGYHVNVDDWDDEYDSCVSCSNREDGGEHLHRYGFRPPTRFFGDTEGNAFPYLGVELETDTTNDDGYDAGQRRRDYCETLANLDTKPRFWMTQDGSLSCGVEVTTQPMTLAEHVGCGMWESVHDAAIEHGFTSHDNGRCGLHVHVNRSFFGKSEKRQQVGGYNLAMLVSRFEKQLTQFSRRRENGWCNYGIHGDYLNKKNFLTQRMSMFEKSKHMCEGKKYEHCQCVNFQHDATFELRIFRGTLRMQTLYATLAMAQGLARAAKLHSQSWCEEVTWASLTKFILSDMELPAAKSALSEYMTERGVG